MEASTFQNASRLFVVTLFLITTVAAQAPRAKSKTSPPAATVFAVLNDGKLIEPIVSIKDGKLVEIDLGSDDSAPATKFGATYYKPKSAYSIFFGGAADGSLSIVKSNIGTECGGATAEVASRPIKAKLKGLVMALATNFKNKDAVTSYRRLPTPNERAEIEKLVRLEFKKNGSSDAALKNLRYHNFTALDLDGDNVPEFVGSYWIAPTAAERRRLFFIAQGPPEKISMSVAEHDVIKLDDVMSGDLKDLDGGRGSELLLDVLDYDNDGVKEIFTIGQAFEGNNFFVYKRSGEKWAKVLETYRYHCAF